MQWIKHHYISAYLLIQFDSLHYNCNKKDFSPLDPADLWIIEAIEQKLMKPTSYSGAVLVEQFVNKFIKFQVSEYVFPGTWYTS